MKVMLIGLGPHAKRIYLRFLLKHNIKLALIVDLVSQSNKVRDYLCCCGLGSTRCIFVDDAEKDNLELSSKTKTMLSEFIRKSGITHAIISTEPKAHLAYAMFLLDEGVNILMDKPITAPINVINNPMQTEKIADEYNMLCAKYKTQKIRHNELIFSIQCQRRFHRGYIYVKSLLSEIVNRYNIPINYIDIFHSDGMWNMPDELTYRENHPYKYGYGKLFHSGYHFIDLLTWILEANTTMLNGNKIINQCSVYSESYRPSDFIKNIDQENYRQLFKTDKYLDVLKCNDQYRPYGELDIHSIINLYNNKNVITTCTLNLMQSGISRRSWTELPEDTYKSNGRIRHERLNVNVGPIFNIQVHSYQAYETKERENHGGHDIGDIEHFDIYIFRNSELIGGKPFEKVSISDLYGEQDNCFIGYNEKAREKCFIDFIKNISNDSDLLLHRQSILITKLIYESIVHEGKKLNVDFDIREQSSIKEIVKITDQDFSIVPAVSTNEPTIRLGARGIVLNDKGEIALIYKAVKNEYKLPGGGVEDGEDAQQAFRRECEEELGCIVNVIRELGVANEHKSQENFRQSSFVYEARKTVTLESDHLTDKEKAEETKCLWLPKLQALDKMKRSFRSLKASQYDSVYRTKFMALRDIRILEYYINK